METYCLDCKKKVEIINPVQVTMKNGGPAVQGKCPAGHKVTKMGAKLDT